MQPPAQARVQSRPKIFDGVITISADMSERRSVALNIGRAANMPNNAKPMLVTMEHGTGMAATEVMMLAAYILPMAYETQALHRLNLEESDPSSPDRGTKERDPVPP